MAILQAFITLVVMYMIYNIFKIFQNYIKARKCGFPMFISPIEQISPFWIIFSPLLLPICKKFLPYTLWRPLDLCSYGFEWRDYVSGRTRPSNWMLIGPGKLDLYVEDPFIATMILSKKKDFPMDEISRKFLNVVGPNLLSSEGEDWQRQRRLIAPMLNERIMENVWNESRDQANDMVSSFLNDGGTTKDTISGLKRIAFNVLQCIGYGMPQKWNQNVREILPGHKLAYMEALHELVDGFIIIAIIRSIKIMTIPFMPVFLKRKGYALQDFLLYTKEMLETERKAIIESDQPRNSLLSLLSTISERRLNNESSDSSTDQKQTLSEGEIVGNLYQFTLAGFDTTATTLAYAVTTLAARPEWQNWIVEEIDKIRESIDNKSSYSEVFPRLERCLALMYETLRIFTPIAHIARYCVRDQVISNGNTSFHIPAGTRVTCVFQGIHEQKQSWGQDQSKFRPTRWIEVVDTTTETTNQSSSIPQAPNLQPPIKGSFLPWSTGPRLCPGMKMAQVEFLSVIWTIFKDYRVEVVRLENETGKEAQQRLWNVMLDSEPRLTLQMRKPQNAVMKWSRRS